MAQKITITSPLTADIPTTTPIAEKAPADDNITDPTITTKITLDLDVPKTTHLAADLPDVSNFTSSNTRQLSVLNVLIQDPHGCGWFSITDILQLK